MSRELWDKSEKIKLEGKVPKRAFNAVRRAYFAGKLDKPLEQLTDDDLAKIRQLGTKGIELVRAALGEIGVRGPCRLSGQTMVAQKLKLENKALRQQVKELESKATSTVEMLTQASDFKALKELDKELAKLLTWQKIIKFTEDYYGMAKMTGLKFQYTKEGILIFSAGEHLKLEFSDSMVSELILIVGEITENRMQIQDLLKRLNPLKALVEAAAAALKENRGK